MKFPTINQYIDALSEATQFSRSLAGVEFILTLASDPIYYSGNFGVVFKVRLGGETFALKCFTKEQQGRAEAYRRLCEQLPSSVYLIGSQWLGDELLVAPHGSEYLIPFDALKMEYVEGRTLAVEIAEAAAARDRVTLLRLSERFDQFAVWLLGEEFAHGDLKPENLMVGNDGHFKLIDYDGVYLPSMQGEAQREVGTVAFQHPRRSEMMFCKSIDDYSLALISLTLRTLAREPDLLDRSNSGRGELLIHPEDAVLGSSSMLDYIEAVGLVDRRLIDCVRSDSPSIKGLEELILNSTNITLDLSLPHPIQGLWGWGFADATGEILISPIYEAVQDFCADLAAVAIGGKWGFIDRRGEIVVTPRYDRVWDFTKVEGLALVKYEEKYGFVNTKGRVMIKLKYDYAASFSGGAAVVAVDGKYGFIDREGRFVVTPQYAFARSARDGVAEVELEDGTISTIEVGN